MTNTVLSYLGWFISSLTDWSTARLSDCSGALQRKLNDRARNLFHHTGRTDPFWYKDFLCTYGILMIKIRRSWDCLILFVRIIMLIRRRLYIEAEIPSRFLSMVEHGLTYVTFYLINWDLYITIDEIIHGACADCKRLIDSFLFRYFPIQNELNRFDYNYL